MKEALYYIEETAGILDGLLLVIMTCLEKGDLPAEAYVGSLEAACLLNGFVNEKVKEALA